jgi:glycine hydroxymethyltransferase
MHKFLRRYLAKTPVEDVETAACAYLASIDHISSALPPVAESIVQELLDQRSHLKMIASENYSSYAVQLAMGNLLTDKYAEGVAHHRFYAGCDNVDDIEELAVAKLKQLFGCEHAYVQPHSGADANLIAYYAIIAQRVQNKALAKYEGATLDSLTAEQFEEIRQAFVNQKILGLSLSSGGHLTHGYRHNLSAKMMQAYSYSADPKTERLDYEQIEQQALAIRPLILLAGYSAYSRKIDFSRLRKIADKVGAVLMVDMAHFAGLVAGKVFTGEYDPVPFADIVTSTTHKTLRGPRGGIILCKEEFKETIDKGCPLAMGGPLPHVIAAKAIAFHEALQPSFQQYAHKVVENAQVFAQTLANRGFHIQSGGTDNHLIILNLNKTAINGRQAEKALIDAKISCNRNAVINDPNGPWYTSGVRFGTAALTSRGLNTKEMVEIGNIVADILQDAKPGISPKTQKESKAHVQLSAEILQKSRERVENILASFPLYPEIEIDDDPPHPHALHASALERLNGS